MLAMLASIGSAVPGLLLRITAMLLVAWGVQRLLPRRASAALRHLVWSLALCGVLVLPVLPAFVPVWTFEVRRVLTNAPTATPVSGGPAARLAPLASEATSDIAPEQGVRVIPPASDGWALLGGVYLCGLALTLAHVVGRRRQLGRVCQTAKPVTEGPWIDALERCTAAMGVRRDVRLLRGGDAVPMTCGTWRPVIILPDQAGTWGEDRRDAVVLHELAHVVRRDCLTHLLSSLACCVAWCHPAVWWVSRRMRHEREIACDDRVVAAGTPPCGYAGHLLDIAYAFSAEAAPAHALPMAGPRQLESRLHALLDASRSRRPVGWVAGGALTFAMGSVLVLLATFSATVVAVTPDHASPIPHRADAQGVPVPVAPATQQHLATAAGEARRMVQQVAQAARAAISDDDDTDAPGTWEVRPSAREGTVHLRMTHGRSTNGSTVGVGAFSGLDVAMRGSGGPVRFQLKRDAGSFVFEGVFKNGVGAGTYAFSPDAGFAAELERRGFTRPSAREQFQMARHDVGFALIDALAEHGYGRPQTAELVRAGQHGVSAAYVRDMGAQGYRLGTVAALVTLRDHGVTPEYVRELARLGYGGLSADDVRRARDHGVTPDYIAGLASAGYVGLELEAIVRARDHGVTPEYVRVMRDHGHTVPLAELVRARDHGISGEYVTEMAALGYGKTPLDLIVRMRDHGVTAAYVKELAALGYERLAPADIITLRDHGLTGARISRVNKRSGSKLSVAALVEAGRRGEGEP